jgi:hypothetical protein
VPFPGIDPDVHAARRVPPVIHDGGTTVHSTPALTFDPVAAQAWLRQPSGTDGFTRAESLGVDEDLFGRGLERFLATIDDLLTAGRTGYAAGPTSAPSTCGSSRTVRFWTRGP